MRREISENVASVVDCLRTVSGTNYGTKCLRAAAIKNMAGERLVGGIAVDLERAPVEVCSVDRRAIELAPSIFGPHRHSV